ncbi:MAG: ribosomal-processing cysteine protease Prp [Christensenellaceae bacterium]|nr:ribosomal-processing cysteine protease Prp [Christensenellaceae bacterium]
MIRTVFCREGERYTGFRASGHSGYAEHGSDIVCAAVSVLGCTCVNSLESVCGLIPEITANDDGLLAFTIPDTPDEAQAHDAQVLMAALHQGIADIARQYPRYVTLSIQERRDKS